MKPARLAALGFRPHSGWTAFVAVSGSARAPEVLDRGSIELCDVSVDGSKQPYHAAEGLSLERARSVVDRSLKEARKRADRGLAEAGARLRERGFRVASCGLVTASARPLPPLASILASHALIHTADGELFRQALRDAAQAQALAVCAIAERELWDRAASKLSRDADELKDSIDALGKPLGPPWRQDEKLATVAALLALVSAS